MRQVHTHKTWCKRSAQASGEASQGCAFGFGGPRVSTNLLVRPYYASCSQVLIVATMGQSVAQLLNSEPVSSLSIISHGGLHWSVLDLDWKGLDQNTTSLGRRAFFLRAQNGKGLCESHPCIFSRQSCNQGQWECWPLLNWQSKPWCRYHKGPNDSNGFCGDFEIK